jgi:hypothetical protein
MKRCATNLGTSSACRCTRRARRAAGRHVPVTPVGTASPPRRAVDAHITEQLPPRTRLPPSRPRWCRMRSGTRCAGCRPVSTLSRTGGKRHERPALMQETGRGPPICPGIERDGIHFRACYRLQTRTARPACRWRKRRRVNGVPIPPLEPGSREWLKRHVASKVSTILGLNDRWDSPYHLWADGREDRPPSADRRTSARALPGGRCRGVVRGPAPRVHGYARRVLGAQGRPWQTASP